MNASSRSVRDGVSWKYLFRTCWAISWGEDRVFRVPVLLPAEEGMGRGVGAEVASVLWVIVGLEEGVGVPDLGVEDTDR